MAKLSLCFVKKDNQIVMINRNNSPFKGLWNALGGHMEENETILECAVREIYEESKIKVDNAKLISISTWNFNDDEIYVYLCDLPESYKLNQFPFKIEEGIIDLKDINWLTSKDNYGVVDDIKLFLNDIAAGLYKNYHLIYDENGNLINYLIK